MDKNLLTILKELRNIQPDQDYTRRSRYLILSGNRTGIELRQTRASERFINVAEFLNWLSIHRLATAVSLISVFVLLVLLTVSYLPGNKNSLVAEADEINASIQIKLDEINYQLQNPEELNFEEIPNILEKLDAVKALMKEAQNLSADPEKMEEMIEKIKTSQTLLNEIESLLD